MAVETKTLRTSGSAELMINAASPVRPFVKSTYTFAYRYKVGTDFTSGNQICMEIDGAQQILFAVAKTPSNTFLAITEASLTAPRQGLSLTFGAATTDVEVFVIVRV